MAALNFKKRFAGKIRNGSKRQTIRAIRKYPIEPGETLYLYVGQRTKHCKKLREVVCKSVFTVWIYYDVSWHHITVDDVVIAGLKQLNHFARLDGFKDWNDMRQFWIENHSEHRIFEGQLITW